MVGFRTFIKNLDDGSVKSVCSGAKLYPMGTPISMKMRLGCLKPHPPYTHETSNTGRLLSGGLSETPHYTLIPATI